MSGRARAMWKEGLTTPLLKLHRPDDGPESYRPCGASQRSVQATRTNDRATTAHVLWETGSSRGRLASRAHRSTADPRGPASPQRGPAPAKCQDPSSASELYAGARGSADRGVSPSQR
ncbi:hypothetical_protein [Leishmania major strain Friedlin]|nr:hypothetical_protein [Leishmania major strain Friedlin]